jgi:outer membrane protein TolC
MSRIGTVWLTALLAVAGLVGCHQHKYLNESDFRQLRHTALSAAGPLPELTDLTPSLDVTAMRTVLSPEGKRRPISLAECIALALENGRTGEFFDRTTGRRSGLVGLQRQSPPSNSTDSIRVFAYDPAILHLDVEQSLAKFDARWVSSMTWNKVDEPATLQSVLFGQGLGVTERDQATFQSALLKPLPTGGLAGITFRTDYESSNINRRANAANPGSFPNPTYRPDLEFSFEQPLLQGAGVGINRIRNTHPGSIRQQIPVGGQVPGILLTRIFEDQGRLEFERRVMDLLFVVEQAYWELYAAYWDLYSRETAMRQLHIAWTVAKIQQEVGKVPEQELKQIEQQFQFFRAQRLQALGAGTGRPGVLEAERNLRYVIGLPPDDGCRLFPSDTPTVTPFTPDWNLSLAEGLARRPELEQTRAEIHSAYLAVLREKDGLLPDLRFFATYNYNALGKYLDHHDDNSALRNLAENRFNDWSLGLRLDVPIGYREAHAEVRRSQLQLAQRVAYLRDQEMKLAYSLGRSYSDLAQRHEEIRIQRMRRLAAARELQLRYDLYLVGTKAITELLDAQRNWADALRDEQFAIADYNIALIDFERQKGTILEYDNVAIADGPIPSCAQARASEHIRERERSIKLREADGSCPEWIKSGYLLGENKIELPPLPPAEATSVEDMIEKQKSLPPLPDQLPGGTLGEPLPMPRPQPPGRSLAPAGPLPPAPPPVKHP